MIHIICHSRKNYSGLQKGILFSGIHVTCGMF